MYQNIPVQKSKQTLSASPLKVLPHYRDKWKHSMPAVIKLSFGGVEVIC